MIDVKHWQFFNTSSFQTFEGFSVDFQTSFCENLARGGVNNIFSDILANNLFFVDQQLFKASFRRLFSRANCDFLARFKHDFTRSRINQINVRLHTAIAICVERLFPTFFDLFQLNGFVEGRQNLFCVQTKSIKERGCRQLAATVNTHIKHVFGVKLEIEPRTTIRNNARGEQQLARGMGFATVMVKKHAWRAVHLAHNHTLSAVDDESAVVCHQRNIAHVNILLFDIFYRARTCIFVHFKHNKT